MDPLAWSVILLAACLLLVTVEIFVPSGGLLGILSLTLLIAAIVMAFMHSYFSGAIVVMVVAVSIPVLFAIAVRIWPNTPIGRQILGRKMEEEEVLPKSGYHDEIQSLIGRVGKAKSKMLPSGAIVIDGKTFDAVAEGMAVEEGDYVKVVSIRTNRPVVHRVEQNTIGGETSDDMLAAPIDQLGIDGIDD